jgi:hypothetical protein
MIFWEVTGVIVKILSPDPRHRRRGMKGWLARCWLFHWAKFFPPLGLLDVPIFPEAPTPTSFSFLRPFLFHIYQNQLY